MKNLSQTAQAVRVRFVAIYKQISLRLRTFASRPVGLNHPLLLCLTLLSVLAGGTLAYYYVRFSWMIDDRLAGHRYDMTSRVFTAPKLIMTGQPLSLKELVGYLKSEGYDEGDLDGSAGQLRVTGSSVEIRPSTLSYFGSGNRLRVDFAAGRISRLRSLDSGTNVATAEIEPDLITNLFDRSREKRRPVRFEDLPKSLVNAVLSAEDKRFFDHPGFDLIRVFGAAWADIRRGEKAQGASTITMQVARSFFFSTQREWSRKLKETFMALLLEQRFNKKQLFEFYANEIYLGNRGSFAIHGFGEAAQAYFGKDVRLLTVGEAAFLAGIIRSPNRYTSAERKPERAKDARDRVLNQMFDNGLLTAEEQKAARQSPLPLIRGTTGTNFASYFVDALRDELVDRFSENELNSDRYRIYTTLDTDLQRSAVEAVEWGMKNIDAQLAPRYGRWRKHGEEVPPVQVALVALDPHSGEVRALIGGRDYASSQLDHAVAQRQPGSAFKPFIYAAAFENAVEGVPPILTPASMVVDEPTTFHFDGKDYTPDNYGQEFYGNVSLRDALAHSLNVATVKVAEQVGYQRIVEFARRLGLGMTLKPTPALALGSYEMTPLEIAAAYTVFANAGIRSEPVFLRRMINPEGKSLIKPGSSPHPVLDPRVAYLVTNVMEDVINHGTGAGIRARGFTAPAAGKTGTSRDGWFAGFTSNLLCVVWVGFDDNRELGLAGANSAAPIWAEFMRRAIVLPRYRNTQEFVRPEGIVSVTIDPQTQQIAVPACPLTREEIFIAGTEPTSTCVLHGGNPLFSWFSRLLGSGQRQEGRDVEDGQAPTPMVENGNQANAGPKRGFFKRLFGIGGREKQSVAR